MVCCQCWLLARDQLVSHPSVATVVSPAWRISELSDGKYIFWEVGCSCMGFSHLDRKIIYWHVCCKWLTVSHKPVHIQGEGNWIPSFIGSSLKHFEDMLKTTTVYLLAKIMYILPYVNIFTLPNSLSKILLCFSLSIGLRLEDQDLII